MTTSSSPPSSQRNIPNPFLLGLWPLLGITVLTLVGFLVVGGLVAVGTVPEGALLLVGLPMALFGAISIKGFTELNIWVWIRYRPARCGKPNRILMSLIPCQGNFQM
jgi:hypothetical protein